MLFCLGFSNALAQFTSSIQGVVTDGAGRLFQKRRFAYNGQRSWPLRGHLERRALSRAEPGTGHLSRGGGDEGIRARGTASVPLGISETLRADFTLKIGELVDQVTVTGEIAQVETERGRISARIEPVKLKELPMNGRNLFSLLAFPNRVSSAGTLGDVSRVFLRAGRLVLRRDLAATYANGQRRESNTFSLDGSNTNSPYSNGSNITPNADSIEEVRVVSNNFSAVDGRGSAARIQVISKAGSNSFHGGVSEYFQNNTLSSRNVFETNGVSVFRRTSSGTT